MEEERIAERVREIVNGYFLSNHVLDLEQELIQPLVDYCVELYWQSTEGGE